MIFQYTDIDPRKKAFVFELDDTLYPEKDYLLQVYYLFAAFLEHTEQLPADHLTALMKKTFEQQGHDAVFNTTKTAYPVIGAYEVNYNRLLKIAKLPLKLLLYQDMLQLLQHIVIDRKQIFILTNGDPGMQLNKIKQTEWHGLEKYLVCYFAEEIKPMPEPEALHHILTAHNLQRRDMVMIGNSNAAELSAQAVGMDYAWAETFIKKK